LASGQDGMGADLGIGDYSMDDVHKDSLGGEFQGLGLSCVNYPVISSSRTTAN
jgi:hypothetical protein